MQHASSHLTSTTQHFVRHLCTNEFDSLPHDYSQHLDSVGHSYPPSQAVPFFAPHSWRERCAAIGKELFLHLERDAQAFTCTDEPNYWRIPEHLKSAVHQRYRSQSYHPVIRVDVFFDHGADRFYILELNTADPSAYAWSDFMLAGLYKHRSFSDFTREHRYTVDLMTAEHLKMILKRYHAHCDALQLQPTTSPKIALSISKQSSVYFDFVALEKLYRSLGADVILVEPDLFTWHRDSNEIYAGNSPIDIIVRDTLDEVFYPEGGVVSGDLPAILSESDLCVVNPTASTLGDQKIWLAHLWRTLQPKKGKSASEVLLTEALLETLEVTYDQLHQLKTHKDQWVLKPSFGFGGHGVIIGLQTAQSDWNRKLIEITQSKQTYIAQKHCHPMSGFSYSRPRDHLKQELSERCAVFSFWLFEGEFKGSFVRMSQSPVINTHQGGALVPVVWTP